MADKRVLPQPLPEGGPAAPDTVGGIEVEWGWRVRWGRKIGQVDLPGGTVAEFEKDTAKASALFCNKARRLNIRPDSRISSPGYAFWRDTRSGRYVEMNRTPRAR